MLKVDCVQPIHMEIYFVGNERYPREESSYTSKQYCRKEKRQKNGE